MNGMTDKQLKLLLLVATELKYGGFLSTDIERILREMIHAVRSEHEHSTQGSTMESSK